MPVRIIHECGPGGELQLGTVIAGVQHGRSMSLSVVKFHWFRASHRDALRDWLQTCMLGRELPEQGGAGGDVGEKGVIPFRGLKRRGHKRLKPAVQPGAGVGLVQHLTLIGVCAASESATARPAHTVLIPMDWSPPMMVMQRAVGGACF